MAPFQRQQSLRGTEHNPFNIDVDDDGFDDAGTRIRRIEEEARKGLEFARLVASRKAARATTTDDGNDEDSNASQFNDKDGDLLVGIEDALADDLAGIIDLTEDDDHPADLLGSPVPRESGRELPTYTLDNGIVLRAGMAVELEDVFGPHEIQFLRIRAIVQLHESAGIVIRGWGYVRTRQLGGMLPCKLNEVVQVAELRTADRRPWPEQALMDVSPDAVMCVRTMRVTNSPFPEHRFDSALFSTRGRKWIEEREPLVCRYRYELDFNAGSDKPCEWALVRISEVEADPGYAMSDEQVLNRWRGGKIRGGSYNPNGPNLPVVDLDSDEPSDAQLPGLSPGQRYTAGDVFAGAGGASRGIERAGVQLLFSLDHWHHAAETLSANFTKSDIYEMEVTDFITSDDIKYAIDILHLSPPCQFWSPAHTIAGQNDEANVAVLFSCEGLIKKFRPRLFTVEQTFGILHPRFQSFFNALLEGFTCSGYSVRWKVVPLVNYGVPQTRRRLIMIGAAPGEKLPPFPAPTHSKDGIGGLKPWATPGSVLAPLANMRNGELKQHDPDNMRRFDPPRAPWDPDRLARTITCSGGQNYHWSGERNFTLREYAVLQGFPTWHKFEGSCIKKQIGNAFAPSVVRTLYQHLVKWLLKEDGFGPSTCLSNAVPGNPFMSRPSPASPVSPASSFSPSSPASFSPSFHDNNDDELTFLGSHNPFNHRRNAARRHNSVEMMEVDNDNQVDSNNSPMMELDDEQVNDLSDTETLRGDDNIKGDMGRGGYKGGDGLMGRGDGSSEYPYVLLD